MPAIMGIQELFSRENTLNKEEDRVKRKIE
jgi:hypothetical protein